MLVDLVSQATTIIRELTEAGTLNLELLKLYAIPLKVILDFLTLIGPEGTRFLLYLHMLTKVLPITSALQAYNNIVTLQAAMVVKASAAAKAQETAVEVTKQSGDVYMDGAKVSAAVNRANFVG